MEKDSLPEPFAIPPRIPVIPPSRDILRDLKEEAYLKVASDSTTKPSNRQESNRLGARNARLRRQAYVELLEDRFIQAQETIKKLYEENEKLKANINHTSLTPQSSHVVSEETTGMPSTFTPNSVYSSASKAVDQLHVPNTEFTLPSARHALDWNEQSDSQARLNESSLNEMDLGPPELTFPTGHPIPDGSHFQSSSEITIESNNHLTEFMQNLMQLQGVPFQETEARLFSEFNYLENKYFKSFPAQMCHLGLAVDDAPLHILPEDQEYMSQFTPSHLGRCVTLDTRRLTPAGLSVLMWILPPSPEYCDFIERIMALTSFKNCVIEEVTEQVRSGMNHNLVIPHAWTYWLGLTDDFVDSHKVKSIEGSMGICIGGLFNKSPGNTSNCEQKSSRKLLQKFRLKNILEHTGLPIGSESPLGNQEHLLLRDENIVSPNGVSKYTLLYQPSVINSFDITGVTMGIQVTGTGATVGGARQRTETSQINQENIAKGFTIPIESFAMFLRLPLRRTTKSSIMCRMRWLESLLRARPVFPPGNNRGFLEAVLHSYTCYDNVQMFRSPDCRVPSDVLAKDAVKGNGEFADGDEHAILFEDEYDGQEECSLAIGKLNVNEKTVKISSFQKSAMPITTSSSYTYFDLI